MTTETNQCIYCGTPLASGSDFCNACGRLQPPETVNGYGSSSGTVYSADSYKESSMPFGIKGILLGLLLGLAIVLGAMFALGYLPPKNLSLPGSASSSAATTAAVSADSASEAAVPPSSSAKTAESDFYSDLLAVYESLPDYDERITVCYDEFYDVYLSTEPQERKLMATTARDLRTELSAAHEKLVRIDVPQDSQHYSDYQNQLRLMNDLTTRIQALCDSWDIDLSYSDPTAYATEITEPIVRDQNEFGDSTSKVDFDEFYPQAEPQRR